MRVENVIAFRPSKPLLRHYDGYASCPLATDGSQFDERIAHGETLRAGSLEVNAIATPGHTPACLTYRIGGALFTGDALFMHDYGTGRCDFPKGSASDLYDSV